MQYFIGWDVGGWNCDSNPNSRDALVILDNHRKLVGVPWRGNLRATINQTDTSQAFIEALFQLCQSEYDSNQNRPVLLAIDIPLGFSQALINLLVNRKPVPMIEDYASNPYLYRYTEQFLFAGGLKPLSPIKDMIGSQATKGMHVLAKFAPDIYQCGIWSGDNRLFALEAYPSACKHSNSVKNLLKPFGFTKPGVTKLAKDIVEQVEAFNHADKYDALLCALIGWLQVNEPEKIMQPNKEALDIEGWIFVPSDAFI
ncbi:MAG: DUF429 domain-containing protein [Thiotrichales bacterium]|nr:DUF429 domain-containing protein [Thiotrichales bacterium]